MKQWRNEKKKRKEKSNEHNYHSYEYRHVFYIKCILKIRFREMNCIFYYDKPSYLNSPLFEWTEFEVVVK